MGEELITDTGDSFLLKRGDLALVGACSRCSFICFYKSVNSYMS